MSVEKIVREMRLSPPLGIKVQAPCCEARTIVHFQNPEHDICALVNIRRELICIPPDQLIPTICIN